MRAFDFEVFLHFRISVLQQAYSRMHCPSHTQSGVHGRPAFTHLHLLLQLFLQPQWTSPLQLTAAAGRVVHLGCICPSLARLQPQSVGSGSSGVGIVACPHTYPP